MKKIGLALIAVVVYASALPARAAPAHWVEGTNYVVLDQPQAYDRARGQGGGHGDLLLRLSVLRQVPTGHP